MLGFYIFILYEQRDYYMKTIKASKLREVLSSKGVSEGFIDRLLSRLKISNTDQKMKSVEKKLDALQKDKSFQALAKKHGFEPLT